MPWSKTWWPPSIFMKRVILAKCAADCEKSSSVLLRDAEIFACERIVVNPSALTEDCPQLRVNEVRIESRWSPDKQKHNTKSLEPQDQWLWLSSLTQNKNQTKQPSDEIKSQSKCNLHHDVADCLFFSWCFWRLPFCWVAYLNQRHNNKNRFLCGINKARSDSLKSFYMWT